MKPAYLYIFLLAFTHPVKVCAQLCYGSTGDAVFATSFDNGLNDHTDFSFTKDFLQPGFYTVIKSTAGMNADWFTITAIANRQLLIVNTTNHPGVIFSKKLQTCPSTTYTLSAGLYNLVKQNGYPEIIFEARTADGQVFQFDTGNLPNKPLDPHTDPYGVTFTTPATGGDVTVSIIAKQNNGTDGGLAIDYIELLPCGPSMNAEFGQSSDPHVLNICEGDSRAIRLTVEMGGYYSNPFYQWQIYNAQQPSQGWVDLYGATAIDYTYLTYGAVPGTYLFQMLSGKQQDRYSPTCYTHSTQLVLNVYKYPTPVAAPVAPVCEGDNIALSAFGGDTFFWTGPNNFISNLPNPIIKNATAAMAGIYHVIATNKGTCSTPTDVTVQVSVIPKPQISANATICAGDQTALQASGGVAYKWSPIVGLSDANSASPVASPAVSTTYHVTVYNSLGCGKDTSAKITVNPPPTVNAGADKKTVQGSPVTLTGKVSSASGVYWTPADYLNDAHSLTPVATPPQDINYTLHALPLAGCYVEATDDVFVRVSKKVTVPNMFTPNNDGQNDTWEIAGLDTYPDASTQVFNRNGSLVFQSRAYPKAWDGNYNGKPLPNATYYYKIDLKNGTVLSGWVVILR